MSKGKIKLQPTASFYKHLSNLPKRIQKKTWSKLTLFQSSPYHPSLRVKRMKGYEKIWELAVTREYRVTFQWKEEKSRIAILRKVGTHDVLRNP